MEGKRLKSSNSALYITAESADKKIVCAGSTTIEIETETRRIHIRFDMYVYAEEVTG